MNEQDILMRSARARRELIRWLLLLAANINRPVHSTPRFLLSVVHGEYRDATDVEIRRELDYLETRGLLVIKTDHFGTVTTDLTRDGIDVVEGTVPCDAGIMRPAKV